MCSCSSTRGNGPPFIAARLSFPAHLAGRETTLAVSLAPKLGLRPSWSWSIGGTTLPPGSRVMSWMTSPSSGCAILVLYHQIGRSWVVLWWSQWQAALCSRRGKPLAKASCSAAQSFVSAQGRARHRHMACLLGEVEPLQREAVVGVGLPSGGGSPETAPLRGNSL